MKTSVAVLGLLLAPSLLFADFGPSQFMERVLIENGVVVQIASLGYGHN